MYGVPSSLSGAPALHRALHRYVASDSYRRARRLDALDDRTAADPPTGERVTVPTASLDNYAKEVAIEHIDVLKVEVEGRSSRLSRAARRLCAERSARSSLRCIRNTDTWMGSGSR
jgi:hypothetical protein